MATQKTVKVSYNPSTHTLTTDTPVLTLQNPDEWVLWEFDPQAPEGSVLLILIDPPFGPFQALRSYSETKLLAKGNTGVVGSSTYFLYLSLPDQANLAPSVPLTIDNQCSQANISPWVKITYVPPTMPGVPGSLNIDPPVLLLHEGDITYWEFTNLPANLVAGFVFPPPSTFSSSLGPFQTFSVTRANGTGSTRLGSAVFESSQLGLATYHVRVWNEAGQLVASDDPSVDGLGAPPGT